MAALQLPLHWLSLRVRLLCLGALAVGSVLPPYVPREALAQGEQEVPSSAAQFLLVEDGFLMKTSSLTKQGSRRAFAQGVVIAVQEGDSIETLAERYKISADTIRWANRLEPLAVLKPGQELLILPVDGVLHTVTRGQTLSRIAELYGVPSGQIATQNRVEGDFILAGQELIIPGGRPILSKTSDIALNPNFQPPKPATAPKPGVTAPKPSGAPPTSTAAAERTGTVLQMPCGNCAYTQYYHSGHYAVDIQTKGGGPIYAAEDGTITKADYGWNGGYGNVLEIDHGNGLQTLYAHNKELYVKVGDTVTRGQVIAWMGNTGLVHGPTGIHVHFEVRLNGVKRNPTLYLK